MSDPYPSRPDDHYRTKTRAWCGCGEWCYLPDGSPCACCAVALAEANPCPHCDGTGIAADDIQECRCGYGGFHEPNNPRCPINIAAAEETP